MKNLLFTGATGFVGRNLMPALKTDYTVKTLGLSAANDFPINLATAVPDFKDELIDVVLHAAGKAHSIPVTPEECNAFFNVNFQGTVNLCKGLENGHIPESFIFISTVLVYGCECGENIDETHALDGNTPYTKSKIEAETYLVNWCNTHKVNLAIIRLPLIAGAHPPGNLGAMIKGIKNGRYLSIAGGKARKSMLMVQDIYRVIPALIKKGGVYNLCDNTHPALSAMEQLLAKQLNKKRPASIPYGMAKLIALAGDLLGSKAPVNSAKLKKLTASLTFSNEKAKRELDWEPLDVLKHFNIN